MGGEGLGAPFFSAVCGQDDHSGDPGMGLWRPAKQVLPGPDLQAELYG
jgi:hypothetical protein